MILIADSGASKTEWACVSKDGRTRIGFFTQGYNPNYITGPQIVEDIKSSLPEGFPVDEVSEIYFYGAGVTPLQYPFMEETLLKVFTKAGKVFIAMDTLASCRALLQNRSDRPIDICHSSCTPQFSTNLKYNFILVGINQNVKD